MDLGGVEGGEGNRVGWMGEGEEGSSLVGEERGKNATGLMGETGEGEPCFVGEEAGCVASLVGEEEGAGLVGVEGEREAGLVKEDEVWTGSAGEAVGGHETGVEGVVWVKRAGGPEGEGVSRDKQGAAEGDVGDVLISGGADTAKEGMGKASAEGEGEK